MFKFAAELIDFASSWAQKYMKYNLTIKQKRAIGEFIGVLSDFSSEWGKSLWERFKGYELIPNSPLSLGEYYDVIGNLPNRIKEISLIKCLLQIC